MDDKELLDAAVKLLRKLKRDLMSQRRFGSETLDGYRRACTSAEGDIEEWLAEGGFMKSREPAAAAIAEQQHQGGV